MALTEEKIFERIIEIELPKHLSCESGTGRSPAFEIAFQADGLVPFPQIIIRQGSRECLFTGDKIKTEFGRWYRAEVPAGTLGEGQAQVQFEGCRKAKIEEAGGEDWIKAFGAIELEATYAAVGGSIEVGQDASGVKIYFGIHKHMHQPYYRAAERDHWDGEKDGIFGERAGAYTHYVPAAVRQYENGALPHAGLSTSWSGTLIEQLDRCAAESFCGGAFTRYWKDELRSVAQLKTKLGHPRCDFSGFGFYHPILALIPHRNAVRHIRLHREIISESFGIDASPVLFPPETAFHVRMIPALREAGVEAVIYDSIHRTRTCANYPYAGKDEGQLPPSPADQINAGVEDWYQLKNVWGPSKISPSLLRPEYIGYEDADGKTHRIIGVPAERYIGNEDARGGFGALQYPDVFQQLFNRIVETKTFDPEHPPFFLLHSDGDNFGGGTDSYYMHNTGRLVEWLQQDSRFELMGARDYLELFPPDPKHTVHLESGSWAGADNGDPQFKKWFGQYTEPYSPDLNSWAVLTALQNTVHSLADYKPKDKGLPEAERLMLTAETSCYWYWTGQDEWDYQVTAAANKAHEILKSWLSKLPKKDKTPPTIFPAWITPEVPGLKTWGDNCLEDAPKQATLHTFVADIAGIKEVTVTLRSEKGEETLRLEDQGPYPSKTNPTRTANYYTLKLPTGLGNCRFFLEATDERGNTARGSLDRVYLP